MESSLNEIESNRIIDLQIKKVKTHSPSKTPELQVRSNLMSQKD